MLAALVASLRAELAGSQASLARAVEELAAARERIAELEARLRQTPRNSSKPPSGQFLSKERTAQALAELFGMPASRVAHRQGGKLRAATPADDDVNQDGSKGTGIRTAFRTCPELASTLDLR